MRAGVEIISCTRCYWAPALVALVAVASCRINGAPRNDLTAKQTNAGVAAATWQSDLALAQQAERKREHFQARTHYQAAYRHATTTQDQARVAQKFADTLLSWGEFAEAQAQLELVVKHLPSQAAGWHDLGMVRYRLGLPAGAEVAFRRAIALVPAEPRPRIALAALLWANLRRGDALREYQALQQLALPAPVRRKVDWAIAQLSAPANATPTAAP